MTTIGVLLTDYDTQFEHAQEVFRTIADGIYNPPGTKPTFRDLGCAFGGITPTPSSEGGGGWNLYGNIMIMCGYDMRGLIVDQALADRTFFGPFR